jgi:hypothetical protein
MVRYLFLCGLALLCATNRVQAVDREDPPLYVPYLEPLELPFQKPNWIKSSDCDLVLRPETKELAQQFLNLWQERSTRTHENPNVELLRLVRKNREGFERDLRRIQFFHPGVSSFLDGLADSQGQDQLQRDLLNETLFILPANDLESLAAAKILFAAEAPYIWVSNQSWGAKLGRNEMDRGLLDYFKLPIKRVMVFEMPGPEWEEWIVRSRLELKIIDHHDYVSDGILRANPKSSLEQLCEWIGWKMSKADRLIAIADRGFIPGLKKEGIDVYDILSLRGAELVVQSKYWSVHDYLIDIRGMAQRLISGGADIRTLADARLYYLGPNLPKEISSRYKNLLPVFSKTGIVNILQASDSNVSFSGDPRIAEKLLAYDWVGHFHLNPGEFQLYGGGDADGSKYMNIKFHASNSRFFTHFNTSMDALLVYAEEQVRALGE